METPLSHLTILVVDDETGFATGLAKLLGRDGHTVGTADNGRGALQQLHERPYNLILCDLRLPELDGQALYHLRQTEAPAMHRRVIFLIGDTLNPVSLEFLEQHHSCGCPSRAVRHRFAQ